MMPVGTAPIMGAVMAKSTRGAGVAVGVIAAALVAIAPAAAAPATPSPTLDQKQALFMQYLTDHGIPFTSKQQALNLAQSTCATLGSGSPTRLQDAAAAIQNSVTMRTEQMQQFAGAARSVFCPDVKVS
jgi:uncharacterized protein DUF732